jgi:hypothetical protein
MAQSRSECLALNVQPLHLWHRQAVELEVEISRERVPLRNAYRHVGQQAVLRINSGEEYTLQGARCSWAASKAVALCCSISSL